MQVGSGHYQIMCFMIGTIGFQGCKFNVGFYSLTKGLKQKFERLDENTH